ncbi:MAG: glycoside hydrolase family 32 protein [Mucilaginibacter sp.]
MYKRAVLWVILLALQLQYVDAQSIAARNYRETYRPQIHFSPLEHWMNDPNGMVYYKGVYHLFFQYFPNGTVWGPMHWGHATSMDMVHWKEQPIALYPDSLGYIFSGSAVVDDKNTSGFGKDGKIPMVAIFTSHDPKGEQAGKDDFQNESIAYSLDEGKTWTKYPGNPVLKNPGIRDFRDPKVMWYAPQHKWVMTLATKDRITFFSSPDLKRWQKESEFGQTVGAHGGVWECPDLFSLPMSGKTYWVLLVNLNPGGFNGGSATQYFVGDFDGKVFTPLSTDTQWADFGPDEYAGVTWSNTGTRKIFLGWMSNWLYADKVPTERWRSAMTVPRELSLKQIKGKVLLVSNPVSELNSLVRSSRTLNNIHIGNGSRFFGKTGSLPKQYQLDINSKQIKSYTLTLSNDEGDKLLIGYDKQANQYFIDRTKSGLTDFSKEFAGRFTAPRFSLSKTTNLRLVVDAASVELFADEGLTTMTCIYFPRKPYNHLSITSADGWTINRITLKNYALAW